MKITDLGQLVSTNAVYELRAKCEEFNRFVNSCLNRYMNNDWGDLSGEDREMADRAAKTGNERILASYPFPADKSWNAVNDYGGTESKLWIITEWDHSVTTLLFPGEY